MPAAWNEAVREPYSRKYREIVFEMEEAGYRIQADYEIRTLTFSVTAYKPGEGDGERFEVRGHETEKDALEALLVAFRARRSVTANAEEPKAVVNEVESQHPSGTVGSLGAIIKTCDRAIAREEPRGSYGDAAMEDFKTIKSIAEHALREID